MTIQHSADIQLSLFSDSLEQLVICKWWPSVSGVSFIPAALSWAYSNQFNSYNSLHFWITTNRLFLNSSSGIEELSLAPQKRLKIEFVILSEV